MIEKQKAATNRKLPIVEQVSSGGVAFRHDKGRLQVAIVLVKPSRRWQLPKGIVDAGETPEIAARREVREEAGIETEILEFIEKVEYWYIGDYHGERVRFHKFVHFYLLKYISGDVGNHDFEVAEARWANVDDAIEMLVFKSEKGVVRKSCEMIPQFLEIK